MTSLRVALAFLTPLPLDAAADFPRGAPAAARWFVLVGILRGLLVALLAWLLLPLLGPWLTAAVAVAGFLAVSGALHFDGWVDCWDAWTVPAGRRAEVLRDPRVGAMGLAGGAVLLLVQFAAIGEWLARGGPAWGLVLAAGVGCLAMVLVMAAFPYRGAGLGTDLVRGAGPVALTIGTVCLLPVVILTGPAALAGVLAGLIGGVLVGGIMARHLGGWSGDVYGCTAEAVQCLALVGLVAGTAQP